MSSPLPKPSLNKRRAKKALSTQPAQPADTRSYAERFSPPAGEQEADDNDNPISRLRSMVMPKGNGKEKEPFNALKLIENATWFGIGTLVLWEVYINSPFFERAAPMAPVVY